MLPSTLVTPTAQLIAPHRALTSCVQCYLARSTLGCTNVSGFNRYPATPLCSVTWLLSGSMAPVENGIVSAQRAHAGEAVFSGPHSAPWATFNPGPVQFFVVLFYPDALN
ncbi:MAG: AraC family transcriptional regulator, partial [Gammaproteobacteria bacterium]